MDHQNIPDWLKRVSASRFTVFGAPAVDKINLFKKRFGVHVPSSYMNFMCLYGGFRLDRECTRLEIYPLEKSLASSSKYDVFELNEMATTHDSMFSIGIGTDDGYIGFLDEDIRRECEDACVYSRDSETGNYELCALSFKSLIEELCSLGPDDYFFMTEAARRKPRRTFWRRWMF